MRIQALVAGTLTIALGGGLASNASAQAAATGLLRDTYGFVAGVNLATLYGHAIAAAQTRTAGLAGVYANWPFGHGFSVQAEGLYSMEGTKSSNPFAPTGDVTIKTDYLRFPLMIRYTAPIHGGVHPYVALGPSVALEVGCHVSMLGGGEAMDQSCDLADVPIQPQDADLSGNLEAGLDVAAGRRTLTIGASFSYGLTEVFTDTGIKNRHGSIFAGFGF